MTHVDDWADSLRARDQSESRVKLMAGRVQRLLEGAGARYWSELNRASVESWLSMQRRRKKRPMARQTSKHYLQAVKQFCKWTVGSGRARESPVQSIKPLPVSGHEAHPRRAFTVEELASLLRTTHNGPVRFRMSGPERAMLYRLAAETGLRAGEIRSLRRSSFELDEGEPRVRVEAAYSKRRREDTLPLRQELADLLREFFSGKTPSADAFPRMPNGTHVSKMIRADLEAAGIVIVDESGRILDFHALRHTYCTNLARAGVHPKTAQEPARVSSIDLMMRYYTHVFRGDEAKAVNSLPTLPDPRRPEVERATGTDDLADGGAFSALPQSKTGPAQSQTHRRGNPPTAAHAARSPATSQARRGACTRREGRNGEGGIRTPGPRNTPINGLANRRIQPLCHLSGASWIRCCSIAPGYPWPHAVSRTGERWPRACVRVAAVIPGYCELFVSSARSIRQLGRAMRTQERADVRSGRLETMPKVGRITALTTTPSQG